MRVTKRTGQLENVKYDKVVCRISKLVKDPVLPPIGGTVDATKVAQEVFSSMYDLITTQEIDVLSAEVAIGMITTDRAYETLASRITASNIHKMACGTFLAAMRKLRIAGVVTDEIAALAGEPRVKDAIAPTRDYEYNYFGLKTLERGYLQRIDGRLVETPQFMLMRVALGIHGDDLDAAIETYECMSRGLFIHATPTLFNSGTINPQMSSCFLIANKGDSIDGIYDTLKECAQISKFAGGIGLHVHDIRVRGSHIRGTNGTSDGIIPMLRVFNSTARYVNQAGKRKGSIAIYLEPWHADVLDFLELRLNQGQEEARCRDLFIALWVNDLFMKRVEANEQWSLFCPDKVKGLSDLYGEEFERAYEEAEAAGLATKTLPAQDVWRAVLRAQTETGTPYILFKDSINRKSNQKNLGTIKSSNLCTEITEYTSKDETAVCNLASLALPKYIEDGAFDHASLHAMVKVLVRNLNKVIDVNYYPVETAKRSNMRHRPIGLGVQGLADVFILLGMPFDSPEAQKLNAEIFETIYFAALTESNALAVVEGPYQTYEGSPVSKGILQPDMWGLTTMPGGDRHDWAGLRAAIAQHGVRNSLLVAPMPTASTSQILGNNECFEPYTSNIYARRVLSGEFTVVNQHLLSDLTELGLWDPELKNALIGNNGSVADLDIPENLKAIYKTVWEIKQRILVDMAADRGAFIDQSQSFNVHMSDANSGKLTSLHFYAWKKGLKTGMYYLRSRAAADAIKFTVDVKQKQQVEKENTAPASPRKPTKADLDKMTEEEKEAYLAAKLQCSLQNKDECVMCGA